ncbi:MAG: hypothetical protein IKK67_09615 [Bacteroidaceae bacterium]|nr:hypothetical protein [Bacteroidaceae bacterium]
MSKNIDLTNMPDTFCMCNVNGCPQAERCLRQTVYDAFEGEYAFIRTVNQKWFDRQKGTCKHFLSNEKLRLPRGFIRTINLIPTGKIGQFRTMAMSKLGFRRYYQARKGEVLLTPAEAKEIVALAKKCGVEQEEYFDGYEETYLWR